MIYFNYILSDDTYMIFTYLKRVLLITILSFSAVVAANPFSNPYQGNVAVGSFDEAKLKEMALKQVLVKVSGNSEIGALPESKLLLKKNQQMLSQYGYRKIQGREYYSAVFDKTKINEALHTMQQPVWGDTRPTTLIWLIHHNVLVSENVITQNRDVAVSRALRKTQINRGINVQFPLMDLDDNLAISASDVRGRFYESVAKASARYSRDQFVVAELRTIAADKWRLSWQLVQTKDTSKQHQILISEKFIGKRSEVTQKMVNTLADYYASQYAILENQGEKLTQTLHISGVDTLAKVSQLNTVFKNLYAIDSYQVSAVDGNKMSIEVKVNGGLDSFKNALIAQPHLQLDNHAYIEAETSSTENSELDITEKLASEVTENESAMLTNKDKVEPEKTQPLYFNWH